MMVSITSLTLNLVLVVAFAIVYDFRVDGAVAHANGPCPSGKSLGDTWSLGPGCSGQCTCLADGQACSTCGSVSVDFNKNECYKVEENKPYPDCCFPTLVCRGDKGFDEDKLES